jgi:hypothetical protein
MEFLLEHTPLPGIEQKSISLGCLRDDGTDISRYRPETQSRYEDGDGGIQRLFGPRTKDDMGLYLLFFVDRDIPYLSRDEV